ncbi:MAG: cell envelope biogenesis protein TolA, partial [Pseudomonadota bacterium]
AAEKLASDKVSADKAATAKASVQREKTIAKTTPAVTPAAEANAAPDEKRDANDIARAAIERLRNAEPRQADTPRASEPARLQDRAPERARMNSVVYAPAAASQPPAMQPLPPAVTVAPPQSEAAIVAPPAPFPVPASGSSDARLDDSSRLTPPADIPSRPLDLRARTGRTSVAEDVVSAAKSVFHAVVPEPTN